MTLTRMAVTRCMARVLGAVPFCIGSPVHGLPFVGLTPAQGLLDLILSSLVGQVVDR